MKEVQRVVIGKTQTLLNMGNPKTNHLVEKQSDKDFSAHFQKALDHQDKEALKKVCEDFESVFMGIVFKEMKATVMKSDLIKTSHAREIFDSMLDEELSKETAKAGGIGIGAMLYEQFEKSIQNRYISMDSKG
jgi:peptidoglycan hydrolase FlgJ